MKCILFCVVTLSTASGCVFQTTDPIVACFCKKHPAEFGEYSVLKPASIEYAKSEFLKESVDIFAILRSARQLTSDSAALKRYLQRAMDVEESRRIEEEMTFRQIEKMLSSGGEAYEFQRDDKKTASRGIIVIKNGDIVKVIVLDEVFD